MVKWSSYNKKHYEEKGYIYTDNKDAFEVKVEDLNTGSHIKVEVLCDYCKENVSNKEYRTYYKQNKDGNKNSDCCIKCRSIKMKQTNIERYGNASFLHSDTGKQKTKDTILEKYGVEYYSQTQEYKDKYKQTSLNNYGVEHPFQSKEVRDKVTETFIKNYGVGNPLANKDIQEKVRQTNIEVYGVPSPLQNPEILNKVKATNMEIYGVEYSCQNEEVKQRIRATNQERYGVDYTLQAECVKEKIAQTYYRNSSIKTSSQQVAIYELLHNEGYNVELNYPVSRISTDIGLFINDIKIDVEYDGWYFHKDKQNEDRKRDEFLKSQGWKILRIKSRRKLPTMEELQYAIDKLVNTDRSFTQIKLDDWGEKEVS